MVEWQCRGRTGYQVSERVMDFYIHASGSPCRIRIIRLSAAYRPSSSESVRMWLISSLTVGRSANKYSLLNFRFIPCSHPCLREMTKITTSSVPVPSHKSRRRISRQIENNRLVLGKVWYGMGYRGAVPYHGMVWDFNGIPHGILMGYPMVWYTFGKSISLTSYYTIFSRIITRI